MAGTTGHGCTNRSSRINNNRVAARRVADILHLAKTWFKPRRSPFYFAVRTGRPMSSFALLEKEGQMNTHVVVEDEKRVETAVKERSRPATMGSLASAAPDKVLFEDSLLDSGVAQRKRRTWATLLSFV